MGLIVALAIFAGFVCVEGMLLAVLLLHVAGLDEFDVEFWSLFKLGLAGGLSTVVAGLLSAPLAVALPTPLAVLLGFVGAAVVLGYFLAKAYDLELKKTSIVMAIFIVVNVGFNLMLSFGGGA